MPPRIALLALAISVWGAGCAAKRPAGPLAFRVVKTPGEYALAAPVATPARNEPVVFSQLMEREYGFRPGAGYIDLMAGMRVTAQRAYFRGVDLKLADYLGTETGRWLVETRGRSGRGLRFRFAGSDAEPQLRKPAGAPPVASLVGAGGQRVYRMFFQVRWFARDRDSARGSVILGAPDRAVLEAATKELVAERPVDCGPRSRLQCIVFPPATTVTADVGVIVNGEARWLAWGTTVKSIAPVAAGASLRVERGWDKGRILPVELPSGDDEAWRFPVRPGDRIAWDVAQAGAAAGPPANVITLNAAKSNAYDVRGSGDTALVFIHCWACDREFWREQVEPFAAAGYRVVTLDLAGHGQLASASEPPPRSVLGLAANVEAVVKELRIERAILVGHSMGGPVALEAARRLKGVVRAVVLVDTLHSPGQRVKAEMVEGFAAALQADFAGTMVKMVEGQFPAGSSAFARLWVTARAQRANQAAALGLMRDYPNLDFGALLAGAGVPVRAINTANPATDVEAARRFAPGFEAAIVPGVGHFLMVEKPEEFNERLRGVLAGLGK